MDLHENRVAEFHRLHSAGCFVMPNPRDVGSARALEQLGFKALATTSAGLAWTLGRRDTQASRDQVLDHLRLIAGAVGVPVNADFEGGYAVDPAGVAANVAMAVDTGIAGLSIEDSSGDDAEPLVSPPSRRRRDWAYAGSAWGARSREPPGTGSSRPPARSPIRGRSRGSRVYQTSMACSVADGASQP